MTETKQCTWPPCSNQFTPAIRSGRHQSGKRRRSRRQHDGALYCSNACRQAAYRWRNNRNEKPGRRTHLLSTVTATKIIESNQSAAEAKIGGARLPFGAVFVAGPIESYSASALYCACMPLDPDTAQQQRDANNANRIRRETAWGRRE